MKTFLYQNQHPFAYADFGDPTGCAVLIQHGLIASIQDQHLFRRLADAGLRLISIARPGYGESAPYTMKSIGEWGKIAGALVRELDLATIDVLGISSGAPYSYAIGAALPDRVRNIFILSGTPALYDPAVQALWPYPLNRESSIEDLQALANELFFSNLSEADRQKDDIRDSMRWNCFGIAQDLKLRCGDWGFTLSDVMAKVSMRHSRADESVPFATAEITARLLPDCRLEARENDPHFSPAVLDDFLNNVVLQEMG